jgi:hypothetical protein
LLILNIYGDSPRLFAINGAGKREVLIDCYLALASNISLNFSIPLLRQIFKNYSSLLTICRDVRGLGGKLKSLSKPLKLLHQRVDNPDGILNCAKLGLNGCLRLFFNGGDIL